MKLFNFKKTKTNTDVHTDEIEDLDDGEIFSEEEAIDSISEADDAEIVISIPSQNLRVSARLHADVLQEVAGTCDYKFSGLLYDVQFDRLSCGNYVDRLIAEVSKPSEDKAVWSGFNLNDR